MVVKTYVKTVTAKANTTWTRLDSLTTPAGMRRILRELRLYFSATSGVQIRLYWETEYITQITAEVWNKYPIPYSFDLEIPPGTSLFIEGANSTSSDATVTLELIVEETRA
jgi:hypothetical protein